MNSDNKYELFIKLVKMHYGSSDEYIERHRIEKPFESFLFTHDEDLTRFNKLIAFCTLHNIKYTDEMSINRVLVHWDSLDDKHWDRS